MSQAEQQFQAALTDVQTLLQFHEVHGGRGPGRRDTRLQSLNKSAVVMLCAAWETYVETVIKESAERSIVAANSPSEMLPSIKRLVTNHIRLGKNDSSWMQVAGTGWKDLARSVISNHIGALNTPKKGPVKELFKSSLGVADIDNNWRWGKLTASSPGDRLNAFVTLRGGIAHGDRTVEPVHKLHVTNAVDLIKRLVAKVEEKLIADGLI